MFLDYKLIFLCICSIPGHILTFFFTLRNFVCIKTFLSLKIPLNEFLIFLFNLLLNTKIKCVKHRTKLIYYWVLGRILLGVVWRLGVCFIIFISSIFVFLLRRFFVFNENLFLLSVLKSNAWSYCYLIYKKKNLREGGPDVWGWSFIFWLVISVGGI